MQDYGMVEEFISTVLEIVPELLNADQKAQLLLGLRARVRLHNVQSIKTTLLSQLVMDISIPATSKNSEHLNYEKLSYCLTDVKGASDKEVQCFLAEKSYLRFSFSSAESCDSADSE